MRPICPLKLHAVSMNFAYSLQSMMLFAVASPEILYGDLMLKIVLCGCICVLPIVDEAGGPLPPVLMSTSMLCWSEEPMKGTSGGRFRC